MSAVSNSVIPRSIALSITLREVSRSMRWPKLLQPRPTAETRRPQPPRLRICMNGSRTEKAGEVGEHFGLRAPTLQACKVRSYQVVLSVPPGGGREPRRRQMRPTYLQDLPTKKC